MKKAILTIAMLFSMVMYSQENITGIWYDNTDVGEYYIVILNNQQEGYQFLNFSFVEQDVVNEKVVDVTSDTVVTKVNNPDNGWRVYTTYEYIDDNTLSVNYEGDYESTHIFYRKEIK